MNPSEPGAWLLARGRTLQTSPTLVMGILNVTPDSFHDGGRHDDPESAAAHALRLVEEGADIIDVGGESTRPGAERVEVSEQIRRTQAVIRLLRAKSDVVLSIDTTRAAVAEAAIEAGADLINDVSAGAEDPRILEVAAARACGLVLMHRVRPPEQDAWSDSYPQEPDFGPDGVVVAVSRYLAERVDVAIAAGVPRESIAIDPGLGFGKSVRQNLQLLEALPELVGLGAPVLVGASRKSFVGAVAGGGGPEARLSGSLAAAALAAHSGAAVIRSHDVLETSEAVAFAVASRDSLRGG
ncbi:MAG: dihydropteroate synthase [Phycisphaerales bacterium]|nr:dihydropteroate synthase [Phycisphaerales bacterium]